MDHLAAIGGIESVGYRSKQQQHCVLQHDRNANRGDQRQQLAALFPQWRENGGINQPAEYSADKECHGNADEIIATEQVGDEICGESAERDDVGVSEVDLNQNAINQSEAQGDQNIEAANNNPINPLLQNDVQHFAGLVPL